MRAHLRLLQEKERAAWLSANAALFVVLGELLDSQWDRAELELLYEVQVETLMNEHDALFTALQQCKSENEDLKQLILEYFPEGT